MHLKHTQEKTSWTQLLSDLDKSAGDATFSTLGLVNLGQQSVGRLRHNSSNQTSTFILFKEMKNQYKHKRNNRIKNKTKTRTKRQYFNIPKPEAKLMTVWVPLLNLSLGVLMEP